MCTMQQCASSLLMIVAQMLNENTEFCRYYLDNPDFMNFINQRVFDSVYHGITDDGTLVASTPRRLYAQLDEEPIIGSMAAERGFHP